VDACHLCYRTRQALLERFPEYLAPRQVYGLESILKLDSKQRHVMFREQRQGYSSPKSRFRFSGSVSG